MFSSSVKENIFKTTVRTIFSSGTADFNQDEVYNKVATDHGLKVERAREIVRKHAATRIREALRDAVKLLQQRNQAGVISCLNDVLACDKALCAAEPLWWELREEHRDLLTIYQKSNPSPDKLSRLCYLLHVSPDQLRRL